MPARQRPTVKYVRAKHHHKASSKTTLCLPGFAAKVKVTEADRRFSAELDAMPRRFNPVSRSKGKIVLSGQWCFLVKKNDPIIRRAVDSLGCFLKKYFGFSPAVVLSRKTEGRCITLDSEGDSGEGCCLRIAPDEIEIRGDSPAGVLYGVHQLEWMMEDNGGPYLDPGVVRVQPRIATRITSTPFRQYLDRGDDPLTYGDGYLDLMAHYGYSGLDMFITLEDYAQGVPGVPEFRNPKASERIAALAKLGERAASYSIGIYLHANVLSHPVGSPLFRVYPQLRGAVTFNPLSVCLCSSEPLTARIYGDTIAGIVRQVPEVRGVTALIGGESLLHCYTRPYPRLSNGTNCPRCGRREPSEVVAGFVNAVAERVLKVNPKTQFIVWPYSAYLWSETRDQRGLIDRLDKRLGFMTCCEKDGWIRSDGVKTMIHDYAISYVGPSQRYESQRRRVAQRAMKFFVKTESSIGLELLNVPYIPALNNWQDRWRLIAKSGAQGVLANWNFVGLTGTLSEEVAYRETWKADKEKDPLRTMANRLAGDEGMDACLAAWRLLSRAFSHLIFCPGLSGLAYFRGPMYLGPAHPLILRSDEGSWLPASFFRKIDWPVGVAKNKKLNPERRTAIYLDDYQWTVPIGVPRMHRSLKKVCDFWRQGIRRYEEALRKAKPAFRPGLQKEIDVAVMTQTVLTSTFNLGRFQMERERVLTGPVLSSATEESYRRMTAIVADELANSRIGLALARKDFRFGYGFLYGRAFDAEMIEVKIEFTKKVLLPDIQRFYNTTVNTAFGRPFRS